MDKVFFELIRVSIGNAVCLSHTPSAEEWKSLYEMAMKQSLVGVCFAGVQKLQKQSQCPPEMLYLRWMGMAAKIQQRNEVMNLRCVEITNTMREGGFDVVVMKGQSAARRYGNISALRQPGDIDVWLTGERTKIKSYITKQFQVGDVIYNHAHVSVFRDTEVEVQFTPSWLYSPYCNSVLQKWFNSYQSDNCFKFKEVSGFKSPSVDFDVVYLLLHSYRHLMHEGLGLRQVMDYYFCLEEAFGVYGSENNPLTGQTKAIVQQLGLQHFAESMMWVLMRVFGMGKDKMPWKPNESRGERLLAEIMLAGNMGRWDNRTGKAKTHIGCFVEHIYRQLCFVNDYPTEVLWSPLWKIWHYVMRKSGRI